MAALSVQVPYPVFYDRDGQPLDNGNIYIGVANLDPVTNPLQVYYDEALTITASQPLVTSSGYIYRNGTPALLYVNANDFSITVNDSKNLFVYNFPEATGIGVGSASIEYDPPFVGAVTGGYTVSDKLSQTVSVKDFGAVGDGVTDDTVAIQAALTASRSVFFPAGTYLFAGVTVAADRSVFSNSGATLKLKALASGVYTPLFSLTGNNVSFNGLYFDGNRANQFANGWSDSFDGGPGGLGRSNRAAIEADSALTGLTITDCNFKEFYAASIAVRDVSNIIIASCTFKDSYLEGVFINATTAITDVVVNGCTFNNLYTGDVTVQANCIVVQKCTRASIYGNVADNFERNLIKLEICNTTVVSNNCVSNNRSDQFNCFQAQGGGNNISFVNNVATDVKAGIYVGSGTYANLNISGNQLSGITSTGSVSDAIQVSGTTTNARVQGNVIRNVKRYGVYVSGEFKNIDVSGNIVQNDTNTNVLSVLVDTTAAFAHGSVSITGNTLIGKQSANDGIVSILGTGTISALKITDNILLGAGAANNRAIWSTSALVVTSGLCANNVITDGLFVYLTATTASSVSFSNNRGALCYFKGALVGVNSRILDNASAAPTTGTYERGDVVYSSAPSAGGNIGFVCTSAGTPGTWKTFGAIAP
jgi:hypothetical protein